MVLFIDTSTRMARVELRENGEIKDAREWEGKPPPSTQLLENIDELLKANHVELVNIDRIETVPEGQNSSFMALRTGVMVGQMLEAAMGKNGLDKS